MKIQRKNKRILKQWLLAFILDERNNTCLDKYLGNDDAVKTKSLFKPHIGYFTSLRDIDLYFFKQHKVSCRG